MASFLDVLVGFFFCFSPFQRLVLIDVDNFVNLARVKGSIKMALSSAGKLATIKGGGASLQRWVSNTQLVVTRWMPTACGPHASWITSSTHLSAATSDPYERHWGFRSYVAGCSSISVLDSYSRMPTHGARDTSATSSTRSQQPYCLPRSWTNQQWKQRRMPHLRTCFLWSF